MSEGEEVTAYVYAVNVVGVSLEGIGGGGRIHSAPDQPRIQPEEADIGRNSITIHWVEGDDNGCPIIFCSVWHWETNDPYYELRGPFEI